MKEELKKCAQFDPSIGNFWDYNFKVNFCNYRGSYVFKRFVFLIKIINVI